MSLHFIVSLTSSPVITLRRWHRMNASLATRLRLLVKKSHPLCILRDGRIVKLQETIYFWEKLLALVAAHATACLRAGKLTWSLSIVV
jgi:hypothetical protein